MHNYICRLINQIPILSVIPLVFLLMMISMWGTFADKNTNADVSVDAKHEQTAAPDVVAFARDIPFVENTLIRHRLLGQPAQRRELKGGALLAHPENSIRPKNKEKYMSILTHLAQTDDYRQLLIDLRAAEDKRQQPYPSIPAAPPETYVEVNSYDPILIAHCRLIPPENESNRAKAATSSAEQASAGGASSQAASPCYAQTTP